ncbi:hypothetical protein B0H14DRAFT_3903142 [Mycena olivaceomarginata]|nr:hypothetical protein B0H14DRAFT_3903142 [Mycena olivaceomarginata]
MPSDHGLVSLLTNVYRLRWYPPDRVGTENIRNMRDYRPEILKLSRVAQRVKQWVEPLLYRVVFVADCPPSDMLPFTVARLRQAIKTKTPGFLAGTVRHLFLGVSRVPWPPSAARSTEIDSILTHCPGVVNLFLGMGTSADRMALASMTSLRRLSTEIDLLFNRCPVDFTHPLFRNITHLELHDFAGERSQSMWAEIGQIPNLTHLAFRDPDFCSIFSSILAARREMTCLKIHDLWSAAT